MRYQQEGRQSPIPTRSLRSGRKALICVVCFHFLASLFRCNRDSILFHLQSRSIRVNQDNKRKDKRKDVKINTFLSFGVWIERHIPSYRERRGMDCGPFQSLKRRLSSHRIDTDERPARRSTISDPSRISLLQNMCRGTWFIVRPIASRRRERDGDREEEKERKRTTLRSAVAFFFSFCCC